MDTRELKLKLLSLKTSQIRRLAQEADVSERALWRIRSGATVTASEGLKDAVKAKLARRKAKPERPDHEDQS